MQAFFVHLTKSNITFVISIAGFVISLINSLYLYVNHRKRLIVKFGPYGIRKHVDGEELVLIHYTFCNASQLPIAITRIQLFVANALYDSAFRKFQAEKSVYSVNNCVVCDTSTTTDILPINLCSLGAKSGILGFLLPQDILPKSEKELTFRVCTNRGRAVQKTLVLYEESLLT